MSNSPCGERQQEVWSRICFVMLPQDQESLPTLSSKHNIGNGHTGRGGAAREASMGQLKDFLN